MRTAIIYISKHGTTEKVAKLIAEKQKHKDITLLDLRSITKPLIESYDRVIIGGSIHAGMIQKRIKSFCEDNLDLLLKKEIGLFICCMMKEKQNEQFENAFPQKLRDHCKVKGCFGGEFVFEKMNFLEKLIVKKVAQTDISISQIDYEAINLFVDEFWKNKKN
ncbi:MAG: flavodoxin domain-containing protein [Bacteroidota bacterium]|nr:flavodoxin domain-containing protein [Bacteroidota bacterium]MDP4205532.1 flavodoxin domain-containing protein [Bacteroidota bacterium]